MDCPPIPPRSGAASDARTTCPAGCSAGDAAPRRSGRPATVPRCPGGPGPARTAGSSRWAQRKPTGSPASRRSANPAAAAVGVSSHCTSSMTSRTGAEAAKSSSAVRNAAAITRGSGGTDDASSTSSATPSARRCGAGKPASTASSRGPSRSARPAKASRMSLCDGAVRSVVYPRLVAFSNPACSSVVFPAPAVPASTSAAGPDGSPARNPSTAPISASRPNTWPRMASRIRRHGPARGGRAARGRPKPVDFRVHARPAASVVSRASGFPAGASGTIHCTLGENHHAESP
jgi:hypothetical protein